MNLEILKQYKKIIISFLIIITIIIIVGFSFIFNYYKDVSKDTYIIINCKDPITLEVWEEKYKNNYELEKSKSLCRQPKINNPLFQNIDINFTTVK